MTLVLSVLPTWLVIKGHTPIEHSETEVTSEGQDEEQGSVETVKVADKGY